MWRRFTCLFLKSLPVVFTFNSLAAAAPLPIDLIKLPPGFKIQLYASNVKNARSMALGEKGTVFVGTRTEGKVYALVDTNHDFKIDRQYVIASDLLMPNGVAFKGGALYVAENHRVLRFDNIEKHLAQPPEPRVIYDNLPMETHHGWRYLRIGPDNKLYLQIGAPCNVCDEDGFATIVRMNLDGSQLQTYARGVRNSVGFDWHPQTGELWFTDNGRDMMGDDLPPDELNRASRMGMHFGYPYCHGSHVIDPEYGKSDSCSTHTPPVQELGAHVASLGMRFYNATMFPPQYQNQVFIAEHGSWNRSSKSGYRISIVTLKNNQAVSYQTFAEGWLQGQEAWGRPVDILLLPDGSLLVSDDRAGAIYRVTF